MSFESDTLSLYLKLKLKSSMGRNNVYNQIKSLKMFENAKIWVGRTTLNGGKKRGMA